MQFQNVVFYNLWNNGNHRLKIQQLYQQLSWKVGHTTLLFSLHGHTNKIWDMWSNLLFPACFFLVKVWQLTITPALRWNQGIAQQILLVGKSWEYFLTTKTISFDHFSIFGIEQGSLWSSRDGYKKKCSYDVFHIFR